LATGHFLGDGRQQIALAYTWEDPAEAGRTGVGLQLFDVHDGFRTLVPMGALEEATREEDYYPHIAVGEFDGDAPQEIALAYATRRAGVRVYQDYFFGGRQLGWLEIGEYDLYDPDLYTAGFHNEISSISVEPGWRVCVYENSPPSDDKKQCFTASDTNLSDNYWYPGSESLNNTISYVIVTDVGETNNFVDLSDGIYAMNNAHIALEILDIDPHDPDPTQAAVDYFEITPVDGDHFPGPEHTLEIVAGDFDGTQFGAANDEIALLYDSYCEGGDCDDGYFAYFQILDVEDMQISPHHDYAAERDWVDDSDDNDGIPTADLQLACGDVDGDGRDEIVRTWPTYDDFNGGDWGDFDRSIEVLDWNGGWTTTDSLELVPSTYDSHQDALVVGDLDLDLKAEIVFLNATRNGSVAETKRLQVYELDAGGELDLLSEETLDIPFFMFFPVLATGDFRGEGLRVGPPSYRVQSQMITPVMFLNTPPMHRDIIFRNGAYQVIEVNNGATAVYAGETATSEVYTAESKREWELSTGFEMSVGSFGHTVSASLDNTYGENFSNATTEINEKVISDQTTASIFDQIIYNGTDYAVWEYPVYGAEADNPEEVQTISVVWPLVDQTNQPATREGSWCDENFYNPGHQVLNVWSYDHTALGDSAFADLGQKIVEKETTGGTDFSLQMSENAGVTRSSSYHNQISAGMEYSYETELNIPFVGKAWDFSFRAYANGSYGHESLSTFSTEVTEETGVNIAYPSNDSMPVIQFYLYWAKAGYLAVDYQTSPGVLSEPWSFYDKPDPAFILPWYGFPDPANPVAPKCGLEKQLFTHDIALDPAYIHNGETLVMTATLRNFSAQPLSNVLVRFYLGEPAGGNAIGECSITNLNRILGPQQCSDTWVVSGGSGEEKIFAVIDPADAIAEMHEQGDLIDNNIGYGLLQVANADYQDPGLRTQQVYQPILHEAAPGLGFGIYLPTVNTNETLRFELTPVDLGALRIVGNPIQVLAFHGGDPDPVDTHLFAPIPAGLVAFYRDIDLLPEMNESDLRLYRQEGLAWVEATCPGYAIMRFPEQNRLAVPLCKAGVFILSDQPPVSQWGIHIPVVGK
ncbi:MAG: hypothetical protein JW862_12135, partial [Anaerolineales bacterium]|nr:hypothetical protein [Anaerolineales bacterium]